MKMSRAMSEWELDSIEREIMRWLDDGKNGGWWLKLDSVDKLIDYHKKTGNRYAGAFDLFMKLYEKSGSVHGV